MRKFNKINLRYKKVSYLKIPIENEKVIEKALALFAGIFKQKKN